MNFLVVLAACVCAAISGISQGLCGFGSATFFQLLWSLTSVLNIEGTGDLKDAMGIIIFMNIALVSVLVYNTHKTARWDIVGSLLPGSLVFQPIGSWLLVNVDPTWLRRGLGWLFFLVAFNHIAKFAKAKLAAGRKQLTQDINDAMDNDKASDKVKDVASIELSQTAATNEGVRSEHIMLSVSPAEPDSGAGNADSNGDGDGSMLPVGARSDDAEPAHEAKAGHGHGGASSESQFASSAVPGSMRYRMEKFFRVNLSMAAIKSAVKERVIILGLFTGVASGVLGGLFSTIGPPLMIFFSKIQVSKETIRGTSTGYSFVMLLPQIISSAIFGVFRSEAIPLYVLPALAALSGCWLGDKLHYQVNTEFVLLFLMCILILSSFSMTGAGDGSSFGTVSLFSLAICTFILVAAVVAVKFELKKIKEKSIKIKMAAVKVDTE